MRCFQILGLLLAFTFRAFSQETPAAKLVTALEGLNSGGPIEVRATVSFKQSLRIQGILAGEDFDIAWKAEDGSVTRQIALGDHAWLSYDGGKKWKSIESDDRLVYNLVHSPIRVADPDNVPAYEDLGTEQQNGETWLHIRFKTHENQVSVPQYWLALGAEGQPISVRRFIGGVAIGDTVFQCEADYMPAKAEATIKPPAKSAGKGN
jgi:hypothetical protein